MTVVYVLVGWLLLVALVVWSGCRISERRRREQQAHLELALSEIELYANAGGGA